MLSVAFKYSYSYVIIIFAKTNDLRICTFRATHVPIGDDQLQHMELARELSRLFNNTYGNLFPIPKTILGKVVSGYVLVQFYPP